MRPILLALAVLAAILLALFALRGRFGVLRDVGGRGAPETVRPFPFRVEARLEQLRERNPSLEMDRLTVVLRDEKGKEVETPDLRLELDGVPLRYVVSRGNYYDRHPSYRLEEESGFRFEADTTYELAAKRGDEAAQPLARLRTPKAVGLDNLRVPASHPAGGDLDVAWTGLGQPAELLVYRTLTFTDENGNRGFVEGGPNGDDALRRKIGSRGLSIPDGRTTIPASYFRVAGGEAVSSVRLELSAEGEGRFLCPVLEPSAVTAVRRVALSVDVVEPPRR